ncbi:MAG: class I SAM-dependent methyltransferase [Chloroflexi bacterium]|nr:class I SAM-dependent methyltransferase [Chloroflexota bacterium]
MKTIVQSGYEEGDYALVFRHNPILTFLEARLLNTLCRQIPGAALILDLGSGIGLPYDKYLADQGHRLVGVDFSLKHVRLARKNIPAASYIYGDFSQIAFVPGSFHAIISCYAIFHIPRQEHAALFAQMYTWLRPDGMILVSLGTSDTEYSEEHDWCGAPMAWSSYTPHTYREMVQQAGFTIKETNFEGQPGDSEYHYWLLAQKRR